MIARTVTTFVALLILCIGLFAGRNSENIPLPRKIPQQPAQTTLEKNDTPETTEEGFTVVKVVDGDTIEVDIGGVVKTVRYIGIDTPETVHPSKPVQCFGKEASTKNNALVLGKKVRLERDISDTDRYGRLLRYVYVGEQFINNVLVQEGYAHASIYPPDIRYQGQLKASELDARINQRGLWGSVCTEKEPTPLQPVGACSIKGNISTDRKKIYHMPGCKSYEKTVINEQNGERMFCSETEALDAGWQKARNC